MATKRRSVLLTVSGTIPEQLDDDVACGTRPRADYAVIAEQMGADLVDVSDGLAASRWLGRVLYRVAGPGVLLAWHVFRRRAHYDVIITDGEQVGLPFALLCRLLGRRASRHVMIVHILTTAPKSRLIRWARLASLIDRYLVYCSRQAQLLTHEFGIEADRIFLSPFMVDTRFFDAAAVEVPRQNMICSVGLERRDYPTLMRAVNGLDVDVVIAAASPWSRQPDSSADEPVPGNVRISSFGPVELRKLYAASRFVVMPLVEVDFQAGITTILEAMAMGRAVVCSRTLGQTDTIIDGVTGIYVPPGDAGALQAAIEELLADEELAQRIGTAAREWVVHNADIETYAEGIAGLVDQLVVKR